MISFADPLANFILGITLSGDKVRRRKPTRLESYSQTSYRRLVSRLKGAPPKDYAAAVRPIITNAADGQSLELIGPARDVAKIRQDIDIPALKKVVDVEIEMSDARICLLPTVPRWTPRLALWLACDLADRGLEKSIQLTLPPHEKEEALRLLQREVHMDEDGRVWLQDMVPDWPAWARLAGFHVVGTSVLVAPYRAEIELASEILGDVCDVIVAQGDRKSYSQEWHPDSRHRISRTKELLLGLGFSECEIAIPYLSGADTISRISILEGKCKGKPYPHRFFTEVTPDQTLPVLAVWHVSAENDPNILAGTISSMLNALRIQFVTQPDETGAKFLYFVPDGKILACLQIAPEESLKAAAPQYRKLVIAEIFPEPVSE